MLNNRLWWKVECKSFEKNVHSQSFLIFSKRYLFRKQIDINSIYGGTYSLRQKKSFTIESGPNKHDTWEGSEKHEGGDERKREVK